MCWRCTLSRAPLGCCLVGQKAEVLETKLLVWQAAVTHLEEIIRGVYHYHAIRVGVEAAVDATIDRGHALDAGVSLQHVEHAGTHLRHVVVDVNPVVAILPLEVLAILHQCGLLGPRHKPTEDSSRLYTFLPGTMADRDVSLLDVGVAFRRHHHNL